MKTPQQRFHQYKGELTDAIETILAVVDPDHGREGTAETPARVAKAWEFWTRGYGEDPAAILAADFSDPTVADYDEMILVRDLPFYSKCEHHLADILGTASIAYIPAEGGKVVGLSKLSRLLDCYARRLQMQERLTVQIVDALVQHLQPRGAAVMVRARHMCMESRGVCQQGHHTVTTALRGSIKTEPAARTEFMMACLQGGAK